MTVTQTAYDEQLSRSGPDDVRPDGTPRVTILGAARRHSELVVAPILLFVALAGFIGLHRTPSYEAGSRLSIGRIDVNSPGALGGFSLATQSLASSYSRALHAQDVVNSIAATLHTSPEAVDARIDGTPLPQSPVFTVL